ncbi:MAG TPA: hypothetical protein VMU84_09545 [Thermoanaerobaculia bacterium]|nr:hypothetical protein [Thermoanaerobaculia bacterium]
MARSFPPDVLVLESDSLVHARLAPGKASPRLVQAKSYRLAADTFAQSVVTPELTNEAALADALRRLRAETGKWERASVLLPDSWFRMNIVDLPQLPDRTNEAMEVVRWSLKRTLPIGPEELRVAYEVLSKEGAGAKVLVLSAVEKTLAAIERLFAAAGIEVILIEPIGLNIWNAIAIREPETTKDRLFIYVRDTDFTTAVFRGSQPLFVRSRNLTGERTVEQELRLSATYLRETLRADAIEHCYVAGNRIDDGVQTALADEFSAPIRSVSLRDFVEESPSDVYGIDAELTACTGVFTG